MLHLDIKPGNALFTSDRVLKVTDFGIAKLFEGSAAEVSAVRGTPAYMAPEQFTARRLGPRTDVYALGVVLYELLAGHPPFGRKMSSSTLMYHHVYVQPPPLHGVPDRVTAIVLCALGKDMSGRPRSARELAVELARAGAAVGPPDWLARTGITVRLGDDVREAALPSRAPRPLRPPEPAPTLHAGPTSAPVDRRSGPTLLRQLPRRSRWRAVPVGIAFIAAIAAAVTLLPRTLTRDDATSAYRGPTVHAGLQKPVDLAIDHAGTVYVADYEGHRVRRVRAGMISTSGQVNKPAGVAVDAAGSLYVSDIDGDRIWRVEPSGPTIPFAGTGEQGSSGDGGPATRARFTRPDSVAVDGAGNVYVTDQGTNQVRRVGTDGVITTVVS
ncbi:MAG TPA: serine/threonine-protein kinase [Frankiaceae bacterium]|nr:serine/threonine-protein kinase [Frankiaceae bacterium]